MIFANLFNVTVYRMLVPKWAVAPMSGAGAGTHGGRANRVGLNALYLALDHDTAVREYQQLSSLMPPGTLVSYSLTATPIVDFTGGYESGKWSPLWEDFYCDWRHCWFNERIEPPSWIIGDEVVLSGAKGILFKSRLTPNGTNLVLYTENFDPTDRLDVFDPHNALPKNQSSWG
ncbi:MULTISPECIES: RES family NAD+ phosphorylase [Burkholderiaceae]|uniref:RES family NAD+ phosphorylase n=1 Tax=Burkholderiaceae TaxID=119060 RepID=UPI00076B4800|nr:MULTISPECIES: RES family NAD+ phosphorylase [Burkholderiaceae]AME27026.1 RES protein [Burkholderia sp. PAMC 26561]AME27829.1 RES protein [Burkholderia sp. PAMC 26561]